MCGMEFWNSKFQKFGITCSLEAEVVVVGQDLHLTDTFLSAYPSHTVFFPFPLIK